jgi:hypothetical protein
MKYSQVNYQRTLKIYYQPVDMKKNRYCIYLTLLFLLLSMSSFSQVALGVKTGLNLSDVKFDQSLVPHNIKPGLHIGLLSTIDIKGKVNLRPELLYSVKGWGFEANPNGGSGKVNLHYMNVPLLVGYKAFDKFTILFGPEAGLLLSASSSFDGKKVNLSDQLKKFDIGADLGLAYQIHPKVGLEMRYNYGFKGLYEVMFTDENGLPIKLIKDGSNRVLQASLFFLFKTSK